MLPFSQLLKTFRNRCYTSALHIINSSCNNLYLCSCKIYTHLTQQYELTIHNHFTALCDSASCSRGHRVQIPISTECLASTATSDQEILIGINWIPNTP